MKTNLEKLMLTKMYLDELYGLDEKYLAKIDQLEKQQTKFEGLVSELKKPNHLFTRSSLAKVANESESLLFSIELELKDALNKELFTRFKINEIEYKRLLLEKQELIRD